MLIYELDENGEVVQLETDHTGGRYVGYYLYNLTDSDGNNIQKICDNKLFGTPDKYISVRITTKVTVREHLSGFEPHYNPGLGKFVASENQYRKELKDTNIHMREKGESEAIAKTHKSIRKGRIAKLRKEATHLQGKERQAFETVLKSKE